MIENENATKIERFMSKYLTKEEYKSFEDMKEMSFVSLMNILLSSVEDKEKKATQSDIDRMFG